MRTMGDFVPPTPPAGYLIKEMTLAAQPLG